MTTQTPMLAFHGDPKIKTKYLARLHDHIKADELERGAAGQNGKGCAVWCTLDKYEHAAYPVELGIPEDIAYLEDELFENLPLAVAMKWPTRFLSAIKPGADLSKVIAQFVIWQYEDKEHGLMNLAEIKDYAELRQICEDLVSLFNQETAGEIIPKHVWMSVYDRTYRARPWAGAGAWARTWAWARTGTGAGARTRTWAWAYQLQADKLVELLKAAPVAKKRAK